MEQVACRTEEHEMSACGDTWEWDDLPTWMSLSQAWSQQVAEMNPFVKLFPFNYGEMSQALLTVGMDLATHPGRAQVAWMDMRLPARCIRARIRGPSNRADIPLEGSSATCAQIGGSTGLSSTSIRPEPRSKTAQMPVDRYPQSMTASASIISGVERKTYCHLFSIRRRSRRPGRCFSVPKRASATEPA